METQTIENIEHYARRLAREKGFDVGQEYDSSGTLRTVLDPETGVKFWEARDFRKLLEFLEIVPSIEKRFPRPSVEDLAREVADRKGYDLVQRPGSGVAIVDPSEPGRPIVAHAFWRWILMAVLELPSIAKPEPAPAPKVERTRVPPRFSRREPTGEERQIEREHKLASGEATEEELDEEERRAAAAECAHCLGQGCELCLPPGPATDADLQ